jgi:hypothetical protein
VAGELISVINQNELVGSELLQVHVRQELGIDPEELPSLLLPS